MLCSPVETEVLGSIPGVDFPLQFFRHLAWTSGFFCICLSSTVCLHNKWCLLSVLAVLSSSALVARFLKLTKGLSLPLSVETKQSNGRFVPPVEK